MSRFLLCLAAAAAFCCLCLALLPPPAQGPRLRPGPGGLSSAGGKILGGRRRLHVLPLPATTGPHFDDATEPAKEQLRGAAPARKTTRPTRWSPVAAAGSVRPELRAVPGGPDPLHHHGGSPSRRPEQDGHTPSP